MTKIFKSFLATLSFMLLGISLSHAQIILNTTIGSTGYTGNSSNGYGWAITFVLENTSNQDMTLTDVGDWTNNTNNGETFSLYYSSSSLSGVPATVFPATGWNFIAQNTVSGITSNAFGVNNVISGMNFVLPANTTYRFALRTTGIRRFSGTGPGACTPISFSSSGVSLRVGDYLINGNSVGYAYIYGPRFFTGSVTFEPSIACTGTPVAGGIAEGNMDVCASDPFNLTDTGATTGVGNLTYQWQERVGTGAWTNIIGANNNLINISGITTATDYRMWVSCSNNLSDTTVPVTVNIKPVTQCYCHVTTSNTSSGIGFFGTTNGLINISNTTGKASYSDYSSTLTVAQIPGGVVNFQINTVNSTAGMAIWIDWNDNGDFETSEQVFNAAALVSSSTGAITVPTNATVGPHRMRVASHQLTASPGPCGNLGSQVYGEAEDYNFEVIASSLCTGTPNVGAISNGSFSVCSGQQFNLIDTGFTMSNGITYQWQQKVGTGGWTNITGANSPIFAMPNGITFETDYRMWIACTNSALSDTTAPITVSIKPVTQCYCIPTDPTNQNTTPTVFYLSQFSTTNAIQNINFSATSQPPGGYADLTAQVVRQLPGQVVNFTTSCAGGENIVKLWIDYNQDGVFDNATETMHNFYTTVATQNGSFVVPSSLAAGQYRIRIKTYTMNIPNMTACDNIGMGSNIDFTLEVINAQPCSGIISTGTASGPSTICATIPFTIITTGGSTNVMGMTTYWQSSPVGANTWTNITGATFDTLNLSAGISAATDYRYVITCPNYSSSDTSNVVTVNITPGNQCYCTPPSPTFANTNWIDSVHTTGAIINFANMGSGFNNSGYSDYTATYALTTYPNGTFNLIVANQSSGVSGITVWIDWDQNGIFDATEQVFYTTSGSNGQMDIFTIPVSVPANALSGSTRMRIRNYGSFGNDPCNQANQGEVEDYKVNIQVLMPCTGTLNAGVISNGNFSVCSLDSFSLVNTGFTIDSGITYHWQQKIGSGVWTNITGANAPTLNMPTGITASTAFRMWITCSGSNLSDTSDPVIVIIKPLNQCYCTPVYTMGGCNYGDVISNVTLNGLTTNINNSTGCSNNGYNDYTYLTPADLNPGDTFALSVSTSSQLPTLQGLTAWIDYNHDGVFDLNEIILITPNLMNVSGTATQSFVVPSSQLDGFYKMRVRLIYSPNYMPLDPCAPVLFGETEDYIVQIGAPSPIVPINFGVDTAICNNVTLLLDAGIQPAGSTYFWSTGDTTQTINVNASGTYSVVVAYGTYYMIDSINVTVYPSPIVDLGADTLLCNGGSYIATAGNAPNYTYLWMPGGETTNSKIISTTGNYSVTVTNDLGCSTSDTINVTTGELPFVNGFTTTGTSPTYNFSPNNPLNVTDYLWDFGDGNSSTLQNPSHTYAVTGASKAYSVSLTISNDCGVQTELASVTVNGNDIKDLNLNSEILKLYPNPTRQTFTIENKSNFKMKNIIITNVLGQQVMKLAAKESKKVINVSNLASGLYQVTIEFDEGMVNKKLEVIK